MTSTEGPLLYDNKMIGSVFPGKLNHDLETNKRLQTRNGSNDLFQHKRTEAKELHTFFYSERAVIILVHEHVLQCVKS